MLTAEQVEAYREDGCLRVSNIFTAAELEELEREMDFIVDEWWELDSCLRVRASYLYHPEPKDP